VTPLAALYAVLACAFALCVAFFALVVAVPETPPPSDLGPARNNSNAARASRSESRRTERGCSHG
jgi:hypothetical protein